MWFFIRSCKKYEPLCHMGAEAQLAEVVILKKSTDDGAHIKCAGSPEGKELEI